MQSETGVPLPSSLLTFLLVGSLALWPTRALAGGIGLTDPERHFSASGEAPVLQIDQRSGNLSYHRRREHFLGYRGDPKYHPDYHWYDGWWYPPTAFRFGFNVVPPPKEIIRPPLELGPARRGSFQPPDIVVPALSPAHYEWCDRRYRSYRAADNSFQPYKGQRRACLSPYGP